MQENRSIKPFQGDSYDVKNQLSDLAENIVSEIMQSDPEHCQELLSTFVSELFLSATQQALREKRRKKQAEGIAKAKAKGVRFGPRAKPLPENFEEVLRAWRSQEITLKEASALCGMPQSTFYDAARRAAKS